MSLAGTSSGISTDPRIGTILGDRWQLDRALGAGGMAVVYAATHRNGARVAIKMLRRQYASEPEVVARFLKEGWVANRVDHPGVARVQDDGTTADGVPFLVMDLLEGETLLSRLARDGALPIAFTVGLACQLLEVLSAAHAAGIVHRDVKPENVFLVREGQPKLLDFGIAHERSRSHTVLGAVLGSPGYMAPEQAMGREVGERTDLWSLAATLFVALTNRELRSGDSVEHRILQAVLPVPPMATLAPELPLPLAAVLDRALALEPTERFGSAAELRVALERALASGSAPRLTSSSQVPVVYELPRAKLGPRVRTPLVVGFAAAMGALTAGIVTFGLAEDVLVARKLPHLHAPLVVPAETASSPSPIAEPEPARSAPVRPLPVLPRAPSATKAALPAPAPAGADPLGGGRF